MIYNLAEYLRAKFVGLTIFVNGITGTAPERCLRLDDSGGNEKAWTLYGSYAIQVRARDVDAPKSRKLMDDVFQDLTGRFGLILPSATVDGVVYPAVQTAQISATQLPFNLGFDDEGRNNYTCNFQIIRQR